jgi:hypothetical protein
METYGIELEVSDLAISNAQALLNRAGLNWTAKFDGTNHVSAEAVSPILTNDSLNETKKAARALLAGGATVNRQTGYHVHLGADVYGIEGIARLVHNWNFAHNTIGALVAKSRLNNHFCKAVPVNTISSWVEHVRNGNIQNLSGGRYYSLNLNAYSAHQTVEIRLHHGTLNGSKIQAWAEFCSAFARFSQDGNIIEDAKFTYADERDNNIIELLDLLALNHLNQSTADFLKARAVELASR